jgi:hypothetical protein
MNAAPLLIAVPPFADASNAITPAALASRALAQVAATIKVETPVQFDRAPIFGCERVIIAPFAPFDRSTMAHVEQPGCLATRV